MGVVVVVVVVFAVLTPVVELVTVLVAAATVDADEPPTNKIDVMSMIAKNMLIPILVVIRNIDNNILVNKLYRPKAPNGNSRTHLHKKRPTSVANSLLNSQQITVLSDRSMANTCHIYRLNKCVLLLMTWILICTCNLIRKIYLSEFLIQVVLFRL